MSKKQMFIDQCGNDLSDKWGVEFKDGSFKIFKHISGGAMQLADMINWDSVAIDEDGLSVGSV